MSPPCMGAGIPPLVSMVCASWPYSIFIPAVTGGMNSPLLTISAKDFGAAVGGAVGKNVIGTAVPSFRTIWPRSCMRSMPVAPGIRLPATNPTTSPYPSSKAAPVESDDGAGEILILEPAKEKPLLPLIEKLAITLFPDGDEVKTLASSPIFQLFVGARFSGLAFVVSAANTNTAQS